MSLPPRTILISASDALYVPLVSDLFQSIRALKFCAPFDLGLLDVGLGENNRVAFERDGIKVAKAEVDIQYPSREQWEGKCPGIRTLTATPHLRRYFPGYDLYIWLDADVWVQTPEAIDTMLTEAHKSPAIFIACELDRCYRTFFESAEVWQKFSEWYRASYDPQITAALTLKPMMNVGVFAMPGDSPMWDAWAEIYTEALQKTGDLCEHSFMAHQLALNIALYLRKLPCVTLPASHNWLTYFALPVLDRATGMLVEPMPPYRPISHLHLTRANKIGIETIQCTDGATVETKLTFSGRQLR